MPRERRSSVDDLAKTASLASLRSRRGAAGRWLTAARSASSAVALATSPAAVAAHAVGDRDEADGVVDEVAVLVALADPADVGGGADDQPHVTAT